MTRSRAHRSEPAYKHHTAVDAAHGVVLDVARISDCRACRLRSICFSAKMKRREILLHKDHDAWLRARRKSARWSPRERLLYRSHRGRVEGCHGEAKTWRGLANMQIQACRAQPPPGFRANSRTSSSVVAWRQ